ncbi:MAG: MFS transporter [Acidimicrobiales bacterium]
MPAFRTVVTGETVSMLGDGMYTVALAWLIITKSSATVLAISLICLGVPRGLLLLLGGVTTDRFSARWVMFCSHASRAILVSSLALAVDLNDVQHWEFYVISAGFGVADAFFWPASKTILTSLVAPEDLAQANAVNSIGEQLAVVAGPMLGGLVVAVSGSSTAFFCDAGTFVFAASTVLAAPRRARAGERAAMSIRVTIAEMWSGLAYARSKPGVRYVLLIIAASALAYSGLFGVGIPRLAETFPQKSLGLGLMLAGWGVGQLVGAISAAHTGLPRHWGRLIIGMAFIEGTTFAVLGVVPNLWLVSALLAALGFGVAYSSDVALPTWLQMTTPPEMLGRVSSIMDIPRVVLEPMSMIMMGLLVAESVRWAFAAASIPMFLAAIVLLLSRSARSLETERGG